MTDNEASITRLRVATWNLNHWQQPLLPTDTRRGAWGHLAEAMGVQVALVQEAVPPAESARTRAVYAEIGGHRNWGSAVVALDQPIDIEPIRSVRSAWSKRRFILDASHPGSTAVARVTVPGFQPITCVSTYGVWDGDPLGSMHRVVADLLPLFDSPNGARVILGGDLNVTQSTRDARYRARADALLAAVEALGLVEVKTIVPVPPAAAAHCPCGVDGACGHIGTWRGSELDHLYVSPALAGQVAGLSVEPAAVESGLSDHVPLVLELALDAERTPHTWDEEAFAVEIGRRHGPVAKGVIEALVSWAEHKERSLAKATGVTAKVLTRFPTNGITAEPELMFPIDIQTEPRASQMTVSVHADGMVVVWLGSMKVPPFDTTGARNELRRALNEIDGVHIRRWETDRWPRFPLERLEDPSNLQKLVALLDCVADETRMTAGSWADPADAAAADVKPEAVPA